MGAVCLLLWGLRSVRLGMTRAFGADLHRAISASTDNRFKAFAAGMGVTALLQSSTATALIIASFCGQGLLQLPAGLAVMLGADVGTTIVAQVLSFDLKWLAPVFMVAGYVLFKIYSKAGKLEHIGRFLIGLGIMLFALMWIRQSSEPLRDSEVLRIVLQSLEKDPILAVLITAVLTWLVHSSLAVVLLLVTLVAGGALPVYVGLAMVLGANLGGALAPLVATMKDTREATRVPVGNLLMRLAGVLVMLPLIDLVHDNIQLVGHAPERLLVHFHMAFNIALAVVFLPLTGRIAVLCCKIVPERKNEDDPGRAKYLDEKELATPSIALSSAMRETLRMADVLQEMLEDTIIALRDNNEALVKKIQDKDDIIDNLYRAVKMFMAKITRESLDPGEGYQYLQILSYATNLENAGDTIDKSLMEMAQKKIKGRSRFSRDGWQEIMDIHNFVLDTVRLAQNVFVSSDPEMARRLLEGKEKLRMKEQKATQAHIDRIREGVPETIATSSLHLDILRDYRRINSYVTSVAYSILEEAGELRESRLKKPRRK